MGIDAIDHVQIAAPPGCEEDARRFFGKLLGLPEIDKPEPLRSRGGVWFRIGSQELHIGVEEPFEPAKKAHPAFVTTPGTLDALAERLTAAGAPVAWDHSRGSTRRFYIEDPWGNRLEIMEIG